MTNLYRVFDRALEIIEYIDRKYVSVLEEVITEEAEILSKNSIDDVDRVKLLGLWLLKEYIARELGLYNTVESPSATSVHQEEELLIKT